MKILGIDIGGSGIKGAIVDTQTGEMLTPRHRVETPAGGNKEDMRTALKEVVKHFDWDGPIGCGFPAVVNQGVIATASNIDAEWIGTSFKDFMYEELSNVIYVVNDADAAALAEMNFGNGKDKEGVVLVLTIGTGIGSAIFFNKVLVPNLEFGQLLLKNGKIAESYASANAREVENLKLKEWAARFNKYLKLVESYLNPDHIILGGGISRKFEKFAPYLNTKATLQPALMENNAGIVGAACYAAEQYK